VSVGVGEMRQVFQPPDTRLSPANMKAMSINDTKRLERVEQKSLSKTQPNNGRSRSIDPLGHDGIEWTQGVRR
jgi:hypothetical protein